MLVVNLIERGLRHDIAPIRIFDDAGAAWRQQDLDALDNGMQITDVGQRVGGNDGVSVAALGHDAPCQARIEEGADRVDAGGQRRLRYAAGRLDSQMADPRCREVA